MENTLEQLTKAIQNSGLADADIAMQIAFARLVHHLGQAGQLDVQAFKAALQMDSPEIPPAFKARILPRLSHLADAIRDPESTSGSTRQ